VMDNILITSSESVARSYALITWAVRNKVVLKSFRLLEMLLFSRLCISRRRRLRSQALQVIPYWRTNILTWQSNLQNLTPFSQVSWILSRSTRIRLGNSMKISLQFHWLLHVCENSLSDFFISLSRI
jgi:hypothetical protein